MTIEITRLNALMNNSDFIQMFIEKAIHEVKQSTLLQLSEYVKSGTLLVVPQEITFVARDNPGRGETSIDIGHPVKLVIKEQAIIDTLKAEIAELKAKLIETQKLTDENRDLKYAMEKIQSALKVTNNK